jgi:hypothetical protein
MKPPIIRATLKPDAFVRKPWSSTSPDMSFPEKSLDATDR